MPTTPPPAGEPLAARRTLPALPLNWLHGVTLVYLALPYFLFFAGWLRPGVAAAASALLLWALWLAVRPARQAGVPSPAPGGLPGPAWMTSVGVAFAVMLFAGSGGVGFQHNDHHKHNALLADLISRPWPVAYHKLLTDQDRDTYRSTQDMLPLHLSYSVANYLPAALIGKLAGWQAGHLALFAWTTFGVAVCLCWFASGFSRGGAVAALIFPLLSGLDFFGHYLAGGSAPRVGHHLEWWAGFAQLSSNVTLLLWTPQHAVPAWALTGVLLHVSRTLGRADGLLLLPALAAFWSPFAMIGLAPFVALGFLQARFRGVLSVQNLVAAPALLLLVALFYSGHAPGAVPTGWIWRPGNGMLFGGPTCWSLPARVCQFYLLEFGLIGLAALLTWRRPASDGWWFGLSVGLLLLMPLYRVGACSDLAMRGTIPAQFLFWGFVVAQLVERTTWRARLPLAGVLLLGALWPAYDLAFQVRHFRVRIPAQSPARSLMFDVPPGLVSQYVATKPAFYFALFKPAPPLDAAAVTDVPAPFEDLSVWGRSADGPEERPPFVYQPSDPNWGVGWDGVRTFIAFTGGRAGLHVWSPREGMAVLTGQISGGGGGSHPTGRALRVETKAGRRPVLVHTDDQGRFRLALRLPSGPTTVAIANRDPVPPNVPPLTLHDVRLRYEPGEGPPERVAARPPR